MESFVAKPSKLVSKASQTSPEVELMESSHILLDLHLLVSSQTSPEVELMESLYEVYAIEPSLFSQTSPEVELMESFRLFSLRY